MQFKKSVIATAVLASALTSGIAQAELSANASLPSNYVFRGLTQTDDSPAVQGGLDYADGGIYAGTWGSTVDAGLEIDLYAGYAGELGGGFGYDVSYTLYEYTDDSFDDGYRELALAGSYGPASLKFVSGVDVEVGNPNLDYTVVELGLEYALPKEVTLSFNLGNWDYDAGADYTYWDLSAAKTFSGYDLSVTYTSEDAGDENEFFVSVSKGFEL